MPDQNTTGPASAPSPEMLKQLADQRTALDRKKLLDRIDIDFTYHAPKGDQVERYALIRDTAKKLARVMVENCPPSRELSTALTQLQLASMLANAAIACNE